MIKKLFIFLFFCFFWGIFIKPAGASSSFQTDFDLNFRFSPHGKAQVNQEITLTNLSSEVFANQYSLLLENIQLINVTGHDENGPLKIALLPKENNYEIKINFPQKVVGKGKSYTFNLNYECLNLAKKSGQIWEINLPKMSQAETIHGYRLSLSVPLTFGEPTFINPLPAEESQNEENRIYLFDKNQANQGLRLVFGEIQVFDFALNFFLKNDHWTSRELSLALPPDTAFQKVFYDQIKPPPLKVRLDQDGNWLAFYLLGPGESKKIITAGKAFFYPHPQPSFPPASLESLKDCLVPAPYWPSDDPEIISLAQNLKTPRKIYDYVVENLNYQTESSDSAKRLGAKKALQNPGSSSCMEFTDLFITLARAAGVPAREINGYAQITDPVLKSLNSTTDLLHAWPEYYDQAQNTWLPVDPTWEKTTGGTDYFTKNDLSHFVFVIHGQSSQMPLPAGEYKRTRGFGKDIQVIFGQYEPPPKPEIEVNFLTSDQSFREITHQDQIMIKNLGPGALYQPQILLSGENLKDISFEKTDLSLLPPYGEVILPLNYRFNDFPSSQAKIIFTINGQAFTHFLKIRSLWWERILPGILLLFALTIIVWRVKKK